MDTRGEYIVIWHALKRYRKRGLVNRLLGRTKDKLLPMVNTYDTEEIANYGFNTIKNFGGVGPKVVRIIRE